MTDLVIGKPIEDVRRLSEQFNKMMTDPDGEVPEELGDLEALQGVAKFPVRVKCATLAWHTLEDGFKQRDEGGLAPGGVVRHEE